MSAPPPHQQIRLRPIMIAMAGEAERLEIGRAGTGLPWTVVEFMNRYDDLMMRSRRDGVLASCIVEYSHALTDGVFARGATLPEPTEFGLSLADGEVAVFMAIASVATSLGMEPAYLLEPLCREFDRRKKKT